MDPKLASLLENLNISVIASTYVSTFSAEWLAKNGLQISINTPTSKTMSVNAINPVYPEIVVWKPYDATLNKGRTVLVVAVETESTINRNLNKWRILGAMGIIFNLVVPEAKVAEVKKLLTENKIFATNIHYYKHNKTTNKYEFYKA